MGWWARRTRPIAIVRTTICIITRHWHLELPLLCRRQVTTHAISSTLRVAELQEQSVHVRLTLFNVLPNFSHGAIGIGKILFEIANLPWIWLLVVTADAALVKGARASAASAGFHALFANVSATTIMTRAIVQTIFIILHHLVATLTGPVGRPAVALQDILVVAAVHGTAGLHSSTLVVVAGEIHAVGSTKGI